MCFSLSVEFFILYLFKFFVFVFLFVSFIFIDPAQNFKSYLLIIYLLNFSNSQQQNHKSRRIRVFVCGVLVHCEKCDMKRAMPIIKRFATKLKSVLHNFKAISLKIENDVLLEM